MEITLVDDITYTEDLAPIIERGLNASVRLINTSIEEIDRYEPKCDLLITNPYFLCDELHGASLLKSSLERLIEKTKERKIPILALSSLEEIGLMCYGILRERHYDEILMKIIKPNEIVEGIKYFMRKHEKAKSTSSASQASL